MNLWRDIVERRRGGRTRRMAAHAKADQTSPVLRGKFVRAQLLCNPPPPPPPTVVIRPPAVDPRLSTRQRFAQHTADARQCRDDSVHVPIERLSRASSKRSRTSNPY